MLVWFLNASKVTAQNSKKDLFELLIGQSVHERIDGRVEIAEKVARVEEVMIEMRVEALGTKRGVDADDVPGRETHDERAQNERDCAQSFASSILVFVLAFLTERSRWLLSYGRDRTDRAPAAAASATAGSGQHRLTCRRASRSRGRCLGRG